MSGCKNSVAVTSVRRSVPDPSHHYKECHIILAVAGINQEWLLEDELARYALVLVLKTS